MSMIRLSLSGTIRHIPTPFITWLSLFEATKHIPQLFPLKDFHTLGPDTSQLRTAAIPQTQQKTFKLANPQGVCETQFTPSHLSYINCLLQLQFTVTLTSHQRLLSCLSFKIQGVGVLKRNSTDWLKSREYILAEVWEPNSRQSGVIGYLSHISYLTFLGWDILAFLTTTYIEQTLILGITTSSVSVFIYYYFGKNSNLSVCLRQLHVEEVLHTSLLSLVNFMLAGSPKVW